ncbi:hypothetical protein BJQ94_02405 [Cryobacterium sp. SO2]|uniref:hypothetical protein n=1 Tax=Cryobacterium sp. SO2 TaxID=1897060 RepID=UPI00223DDA53|nr:hypothetical protein [Cryobacterium sp. SO2]WEO77917.1 hypothetical protein BJQ94_02405 [Cryobacterium sp. SO2]
MEPHSELTKPHSVHVLETAELDGGVSAVTGFATLRGERVYIQGVKASGLVSVNGPMSLQNVPGLGADHQTGSVSGDVPFDWLERFWLIRTSHFDRVDERSPAPGLTAVIAGTTFGVTDTCGTVSETGERQLQLVWLGATQPDGPEWVLDGYGCWTTLVPRRSVAVVTYVEWTALWRDITVNVAGVQRGLAHIFVPSGGVPEFDAPEIEHGASVRGCWSAVVPLSELSLRSWISVDHPAGPGVVTGEVGLVKGRTTILARPMTAAAGTVLAVKNRGQTVTPDFVLHSLHDAHVAPVEWRAQVRESDLTGLRRISSTTRWRGESAAVNGADDTDDVVYVPGESAAWSELAELHSSAEPITPDALPTRALAVAGQYKYSEYRL